MVTPITGFSLGVHLLIILTAKLVNAIRGVYFDHPAYKTKDGYHGRWTKLALADAVICFLLVFSIFGGISFLTKEAVVASVSDGADEPHVVFVRELYADVTEGEIDWRTLSREVAYISSPRVLAAQEIYEAPPDTTITMQSFIPTRIVQYESKEVDKKEVAGTKDLTITS